MIPLRKRLDGIVDTPEVVDAVLYDLIATREGRSFVLRHVRRPG
jgi:hypothetical protein